MKADAQYPLNKLPFTRHMPGRKLAGQVQVTRQAMKATLILLMVLMIVVFVPLNTWHYFKYERPANKRTGAEEQKRPKPDPQNPSDKLGQPSTRD